MSYEEIMNFGSSIFVDGLVNFLISSLMLFVVAKIINVFINKVLMSAIPDDSERNVSFYIKTINRVVYVIVIFIVFSNVIPLKSLGTTVLSASSILAVIIGIASQETLSNFVSGFILSIYQPFKINDVIILKEKDLTGTVIFIGFRHTIIRTIDNTNIIVPNNIMNTAIIENRKTDTPLYRNTLAFDISYDSDMDLAKEIIKKNTLKHLSLVDARDEIQKENNEEVVRVLCTNLKEFSIELSAIFYTVDFGTGYGMKSDLRESILKEFRKNGIGVAHPTRVVKQK